MKALRHLKNNYSHRGTEAQRSRRNNFCIPLRLRASVRVILIVLVLVGCDNFGGGPSRVNNSGGGFDTDNSMSEKWKFITIYLDGQIPEPEPPPPSPSPNVSARAMTPDTARMSFDYFEIVFQHEGFVARTSWEIGTSASIYDVPRTGGVDYAATSGGTAAIMFAGRMNDLTVLAFGRLYSVDDVVGTVITEDSVFVTFQFYAITAKASMNAAQSSFITNYYDTDPVGAASVKNTLINRALIGGRAFPLYVLPAKKANIQAFYEFKLGDPGDSGGEADWSDFSGGVLVAADETPEKMRVEKREARYPAGNKNYWYAIYPMDSLTKVSMLNNLAKDAPVQSPVEFSIDTSEADQYLFESNGIFTLAFEIPVYALSTATQTVMNSEGEIIFNAAEEWHIRPAYKSYYYNIDNGNDHYGGALLMGVTGGIDVDVNRKRL